MTFDVAASSAVAFFESRNVRVVQDDVVAWSPETKVRNNVQTLGGRTCVIVMNAARGLTVRVEVVNVAWKLPNSVACAADLIPPLRR